jgi:hypothetical protein
MTPGIPEAAVYGDFLDANEKYEYCFITIKKISVLLSSNSLLKM